MVDKSLQAVDLVVRQKLSEILSVSPETLSDTTDLFNDLNMDSLALYELVIDLEEHFHLQISDEDLESMRTISDVTLEIKRRTPAGRPSRYADN